MPCLIVLYCASHMFFLQIEDKTLHRQKRDDSLKTQVVVSIFYQNFFFVA